MVAIPPHDIRYERLAAVRELTEPFVIWYRFEKRIVIHFVECARLSLLAGRFIGVWREGLILRLWDIVWIVSVNYTATEGKLTVSPDQHVYKALTHPWSIRTQYQSHYRGHALISFQTSTTSSHGNSGRCKPGKAECWNVISTKICLRLISI